MSGNVSHVSERVNTTAEPDVGDALAVLDDPAESLPEPAYREIRNRW